MQHLTPAQLRGQLIQELASWPSMGERAQRQLLVEGAGYSDLVPEIDWTGSAVIWDDDREGEMIDDQVAELHRRDAGIFWLLAQALLSHADQRIVDLASRAIERAEHAERDEPVDVTIMAELGEIIDEVAGVNPDQIRAESTFVDDLDIDSLSMVEIAVAAQDKFGVEVPDDDLKKFFTVGDVVNYIKKALAEQGRRLRR
jgi:acyl carrier protein